MFAQFAFTFIEVCILYAKYAIQMREHQQTHNFRGRSTISIVFVCRACNDTCQTWVFQIYEIRSVRNCAISAIMRTARIVHCATLLVHGCYRWCHCSCRCSFHISHNLYAWTKLFCDLVRQVVAHILHYPLVRTPKTVPYTPSVHTKTNFVMNTYASALL